MNIFRGDIHRLTRQSYAEGATDRERLPDGSGAKTIVPRCKPLRYALCGALRVDYAIRRKLCCMLILKNSSISRLNVRIANLGTVGIVRFLSLANP